MKKVFCAFFTNLDFGVRKHKLKIPEDMYGKEVTISKKEFGRMFLKIEEGEIRIGGNAGNAAIALNDLGYKVILSCPCRNELLMRLLQIYKNIFVCKGKKEVRPINAIEKHPLYLHLIFKKGNERAIFTYDEISENFVLDQDFWNNIGKAKYLFLSGFHLIREKKYKEKIDWLVEKLRKSKVRIHLEFGYGYKTMIKAFERLVEEDLLFSFGLDREELEFYFKNNLEKVLEPFFEGKVQRVLLHQKEFCIVASRHSFKKEKKIHLEANKYTTGLVLRKKEELVLPKKESKALEPNVYLFYNFYSKNPLFRAGLGDRFSAVWFIKGIK